MNYFKINLNKLEDKALALRIRRNEVIQHAMIAGILFILLSIALIIHGRLSSKMGDFKATAAGLKAQIAALQQKENFVSEQEVYALDRLNSSRVFWTKKLTALAYITDKTMALTELRYERGSLTIRGVARASRTSNNFDIISRFIEKLKAEEAFQRDFKTIEFRSSTRMDFQEQSLLNFEIFLQ